MHPREDALCRSNWSTREPLSCAVLRHKFPSDQRAGIKEDRIAVGVIAIIVGVENIANGLIGSDFDSLKNLARSPGEISIDDQDMVLENHPGAIGKFAKIRVTLPNVDVGGQIASLCPAGRKRRRQKQKSREGKESEQMQLHNCIL